MALYENGKRISGIRDFPAYTWAEYHALPVAQRPKVWKCTDRDYTEIPDIFYKDFAVAGKTISNYEVSVPMGVSQSEYEAIGLVECGTWSADMTFSIIRTMGGTFSLAIRNKNQSGTIPSWVTPVRVYFVSKNRVNATPLP